MERRSGLAAGYRVGRKAMPARKMTIERKGPPRRRLKPGTAGPRSAGRLQRAIDETVRREIKSALAEANGVITDAARLLGISRIALRARMNALGISG
jgi:transcriptional regulator with GAF, ATPase, and Fis domain